MAKVKNVRGLPKSGRVWKVVRTQRFSTIRKDKGLRNTWDEKMVLKKQLKKRREEDKERMGKRAAKKEARRLAEQTKAEQKLANERRAEVVVPIINTAKIKRMKRSQLRSIEKR